MPDPVAAQPAGADLRPDRPVRDRDHLLRRRAAARGAPARPEARQPRRRRAPLLAAAAAARRAPTRRSRSSPARSRLVADPRERRGQRARDREGHGGLAVRARGLRRRRRRDRRRAVGRRGRARHRRSRAHDRADAARPAGARGRAADRATARSAASRCSPTRSTDVQANVSLIRRRILVAGGDRVPDRRARRLPRGARAVAARQAARARRPQGRRGRLLGPHPSPTPTTSSASSAPAFDDMQGQLARLDHARKQFIAQASHELRTPLFSLGGFLELLEDEELDEPTRRQFLDHVRAQVDRLTKLATELLDLSRLEAGVLELRPEPTDVAPARARRRRRVHARGRARTARTCALQLDPDPMEIECDPERVAQVVRILLDNALDPHARGDGRRRFGGAGERAGTAGGLRLRPRHPPPDHAPHLRALLHLLRPRPGRRPRPGDRARAGRAHERRAVRPLRARARRRSRSALPAS